LQPFTLPNGTELKNRLLMAPMTTCTGYFVVINKAALNNNGADTAGAGAVVLHQLAGDSPVEILMTSNERILQPFTLPNGTELKNRLLMAPMTTCTTLQILKY
jgi:2,4-dienoyl-CoA reductase-like NADH-dependent reductase (Old Yellow Enzyme family)